MYELIALITIFFLPLFPFSILFNALFGRLPDLRLRGLLLLIWPQIGLGLLLFTPANVNLPLAWVTLWAMLTAALYAFRLLALREMNRWISLLATSSWALLWIPALNGEETLTLHLSAFWFSAPLVLLALLATALQQRFGAAYTGLYTGLATYLPRFSGILVFTVLAVTATPLFPAFFVMLGILLQSEPMIALGLVIVWLLWSWAGARLLQSLLVGQPNNPSDEITDFSAPLTWRYTVLLTGLAISGMYLTGVSA
jgi:hypothetical protein